MASPLAASAMTVAPAPSSSASSRKSRAMAPRPAPSAIRTAISFCRRVARMSTSAATLPSATRSTSAAAAATALQNRTHARHVLVVRRGDDDVPLRREPRRSGAHERRDARRRLGLRDPFTQPHHVWIRGSAQRREDVGVRVGVPEVRRQHAGNRERFGFLRAIADVGVERLPDDVRIAAEAALPQAMADERDLRAAGHEGRRVEAAAESRPHAEPLDEIRRDPRARRGFRVVAADQVEHVEIPGDGMLDHVGERGPVQAFEIVRRVGARRGVADRAEAVGSRVRQPAHQVGIHRRQYRRAERDAKAERKHCRGGKPSRLDQRAEGDAQIRQQRSSCPEDGGRRPKR